MVYTVITIIIVLASILLIGIVLIQNSKGGGLASSFQAQNQIMGVRKTTDFIEKATWVLIIVVVFLSIVSVKFSHNENTGDESQVKEQVEDILPSSTTTNQE
ncbi:MAG: preprotein translocase subunit SecG [Paludibacteraceae bacterium]|nr:preprotein translocase subunit SecG [Paludibacteraceae bacterium]MBR5971154.1 preprotein translocase subunit SecG [Paludibacteraceae bacterium]